MDAPEPAPLSDRFSQNQKTMTIFGGTGCANSSLATTSMGRVGQHCVGAVAVLRYPRPAETFL